MAQQQYTDLSQGVLASAYTPGDLSLSLTDASSFPAAGDFYVAMSEDEDPPDFFLKVTARAVNTLTVTTASGTQIAMPAGAKVTAVMNTAAFNACRAEINRTGTRANLPADGAGRAGDTYQCTDGPYRFIHNGAAWIPYVGAFKCVEPLLADFAWINQGTATATTTQGGIRLLAPAVAGTQIRILKKAAPVTPYTITALLWLRGMHLNYQGAGLTFRQSSDGKTVLFNTYVETTGPKMQVLKVGTGNYPNADQFLWHSSYPLVMRIADDGVNRISSWSPHGSSYETFHSVGRTDFLTADEVGFHANSENALFAAEAWLLSWEQS